MSSSTGHIASNRNNRALQKSGRKSFFKKYKLTDYGRSHQSESIELSERQKSKSNRLRGRRRALQLGLIFIVFIGLWWYVFNL